MTSYNYSCRKCGKIVHEENGILDGERHWEGNFVYVTCPECTNLGCKIHFCDKCGTFVPEKYGLIFDGYKLYISAHSDKGYVIRCKPCLLEPHHVISRKILMETF